MVSVWDATLDMKYQRIALKKIGSYVGNGFKIKGIPFLIRIAIRLGFIPIRMLAWGISFAYVIGYIFKNCCSRLVVRSGLLRLPTTFLYSLCLMRVFRPCL